MLSRNVAQFSANWAREQVYYLDLSGHITKLINSEQYKIFARQQSRPEIFNEQKSPLLNGSK